MQTKTEVELIANEHLSLIIWASIRFVVVAETVRTMGDAFGPANNSLMV